MSLFSDNLKFLRNKRNLTQKNVADDLLISRERLAKYEDGTQPPFDLLRSISQYFHISIDILISVDLRKVNLDDLLKLGDNRILLPIAVDSRGENVIEIVPHKAQAGYLAGYSDPEFIESLEHISLPFLTNGKFRAFPVEGDSMPPHRDGDVLVARYVESLEEIKDGKTYLLLTKNNGIVYKRLHKSGKDTLALQSDNKFYRTYDIRASEILEVWEFACSIARREFEPVEFTEANIKDMFVQLKNEIAGIRQQLPIH